MDRDEELEVSYVEDGRLAEAESRIEASRVFPALADIYGFARDRMDDKRERVDIVALLAEAPNVPRLFELEAAIRSKRRVATLYKRVKSLSRITFYTALIHLVLVGVTVLLEADPVRGWVAGYVRTAFIVAAVTSLCGMLGLVTCFKVLRGRLGDALSAAGEMSGTDA